jgi:hypothetical protein
MTNQTDNEPRWERQADADGNGEIYMVGELAYGTSHSLEFVSAPASETGGRFNGLTNEVVIDILVDRLFRLNAKFPCRENSLAITHLEDALHWLEERTRQRRRQGVEGQYTGHTDDRTHYRAR